MLLNQWIKVKCHAKTAVIFKFLRHHLVSCFGRRIFVSAELFLNQNFSFLSQNALLKAKIHQPQLDLDDLNPGIMELTIQMLQMPRVK